MSDDAAEYDDEPECDPQASIGLGIDASQYLESAYGRGRYLGSFLMDLAKHPQISPILIADEPLCSTLTRRFSNTPVDVRLPSEIKRDALDLVWYPYGTMPFACDAPQILTLHDLGPYAASLTDSWHGFLPTVRDRHALDRSVRTAERIIALSEWSKLRIADTLDVDPDAIDVVPPLPDTSWSPGPQELKHPELGEMPFVLMVAGWKKHHDLELIFHCFEHEFRKAEIQLVICGKLDDERLARFKKLPHFVHIDGKLDDGTLRGLYRNAAAVVHPAPKSHWSQVCAEALACGAPLLAAEGGSADEIVGDAGYLLPIDEPQTWALTLREVLDDNDLSNDLREGARARWGSVSRRTSLESLIARILTMADDDWRTLETPPY